MIMSQTALRGVQVPSLRNIRAAATAAEWNTEIEMDGPYAVKETATGVRCGNHGRGVRIYHANSVSVRECYSLMVEALAYQEAEARAELAYERHLEDRGYWEGRAQEDWEERHGVIQFEDAYRAACPELFE